MRSVAAPPKLVQYHEAIVSSAGGVLQEYDGNYSYVPDIWTRSEVTKVPWTGGFRAPTPYRSDRIIHQPLGVSAERPDGYGDKYVWTDGIQADFWRLPEFPTEDTSLRSVLVYRCLAKVKDEKINLAVTLAEIGDVVKMITKHVHKFRSAYNAARRGNWKRAYDILGISRNYKSGRRDLASGWLEMIYGWLPLMADVHGAISEVNRKVLSEGYTIVGRARYENSGTAAAINPRFYRWGFCSARINTTVMTRVEQKASMWFRVDMPALQRAAAVGLLNPLALAWELVPFSFLADWWSTIGDWLASLDATVGLQYLGGSHTFYAFQETLDQSATEYSGGKLTATPGFYSRESMLRSVLAEVPEEKFVLTNPWSTSHAITAVALTVTSLKTR